MFDNEILHAYTDDMDALDPDWASGISNDESSEEDAEEEAIQQKANQAKHGASPEELLIREVQNIVDNSAAYEAEQILSRGGRSAAAL